MTCRYTTGVTIGLIQVLPNSTKENVKFKSSVLGTFSADIFIPPNTIDFVDVFSNFEAKLADSPVVLVVIVLLHLFFVTAALLAFRSDRKDEKMVMLLKLLID